MSYIYLNFSDLSEETQEYIKDMARDEVRDEITQEEADAHNMDIDDLIEEKIDSKLLDFSHSKKFVFNI